VTPSKPLTPTELDALERLATTPPSRSRQADRTVLSEAFGDIPGEEWDDREMAQFVLRVMERATLDATQAVEHPRDAYQRGFKDGRKSARSSSAPAELPELDAAWKEAEEALPEGWALWGVRWRSPNAKSRPKGQYEAWAGQIKEHRAGASGYSADTPAAALRALAAKLMENR
jgi:hypothetical protein